jgi:hypothetical protein
MDQASLTLTQARNVLTQARNALIETTFVAYETSAGWVMHGEWRCKWMWVVGLGTTGRVRRGEMRAGAREGRVGE